VIDDVNLHEWAEFNVPAELRDRAIVLSPLARRVLSPSASSPGTDVVAERRLPTLSSLLLPAFGFRTLPKP